MLDKEEIDKRFPIFGQEFEFNEDTNPGKMTHDVTCQLRFTAELLNKVLPEGLGKGQALLYVEEVELWALKAIDDYRRSKNDGHFENYEGCTCSACRIRKNTQHELRDESA